MTTTLAALLATLSLLAAPAVALAQDRGAEEPAARQPAQPEDRAVLPASPVEPIASGAESAAATGEGEDPCDGLSRLADDPAPVQAPLGSPRQRTWLACQVREAIARRYVFYPVKGELLSRSARRFDPRAHLDACVAAERAIAREDDPLRFYDRMRRCTAAFEDGHLIVEAPVRLPQVAAGIALRLAGGKAYVAGRQRELVARLAATTGQRDLGDVLAPGNEVVAADGRPALEQVRALAAYLPASSEAARLERAVDALTRRDFAYPDRPVLTLVVVAEGVRRAVELPWWLEAGAAENPITRAFALRTGLATSGLVDWASGATGVARPPDGVELATRRSDSILPPPGQEALRELRDDSDRLAARLGEVASSDGRAYCYLQVLTFQAETLAGPDGRQPFMVPLERFVRTCREKALGLVLDLRQNGGGYLAHSSALFELLAEPGKSYPGGALVLRATTMNELVYRQRSPARASATRAGDAMDPRHIAEAIGLAGRDRAGFTPAFLEPPLRAAGSTGGFPGRVVALVSPTCMSACDRLAALLQRSGRAMLVGGPTEGAGGSQQETRGLPVRWSDADGLVALSLPNAAMGVQPALPPVAPATPAEAQAATVPAAIDVGAPARPAAGSERAVGAAREFTAGEFFKSLTFENRPVVPDVAYATRLDDLTHANRGWREQAERALFGADAPAVGVVASSPKAPTAAHAP